MTTQRLFDNRAIPSIRFEHIAYIYKAKFEPKYITSAIRQLP